MKTKRGLKKYLAGLLSTALIFSLILQAGMVYAEDEGSTELSLTVDEGDLTITVPPAVPLYLDPVEETSPSPVNELVDVEGTVEEITVTDLRGSAIGWSVSATSTNLGLVYDEDPIVGTGDKTIEVVGRYDGDKPRTAYEPEGSVHSGEIKVVVASSPAYDLNIFAPSGEQIATNAKLTHNVDGGYYHTERLGIEFRLTDDPPEYYAEGDEFKVLVDHHSYTTLEVTPDNLSSEAEGEVELEEPFFFEEGTETESVGSTVVTALVGYGTGVNTLDNLLKWTLHANPLAGDFAAVLVYTVS